MKVLKLITFGHILLSVPFIAGIFTYYKYSLGYEYLMIFLSVGFLYWSVVTPFYKNFCIKRINNRADYFKWKKQSIRTLLFWPDNFLLTSLEFWDEERYLEYVNRCKKLITQSQSFSN